MSTDFETAGVVVKGLEALGRGIVDKSGRPSGSPANWSATAGKTAELPPPTDEEIAVLADKIGAELLSL